MADTVSKEQYDVLVKRLEQAEATAHDVVKKEIDLLKSTNEKLATSAKTLEDNVTSLKSELVASKELAKAHEDKATQLNDKIKTLETELAAAKQELDSYAKQMCKSKRKAAMAQLAIDEAKQEDILNKLATASDEIFDEFVKAFPKKTVETTTTASVKETLKEATQTNTIVIVPSDTQELLAANASQWFAETLSVKSNKKGE